MSQQLQERLQLLSTNEFSPLLASINHGIEKEGLRTNMMGELSQTAHPAGLGSALSHPWITTDYSEALLEFITPVRTVPEDAIGFLEELHAFTYGQLDRELVWAASMPCFLGGEDSIRVARYGSSNIGTLKHVYRVGLAWRYGKMMQTVAGIHFNFSLPEEFWRPYAEAIGEDAGGMEFQSSQYFALVRNFRRYSWLLLYLFGASPAVCGSFLQGREHNLDSLEGRALFKPWATSLRMGDLGYTSEAQSSLDVNYNSLDDYVRTLGKALTVPYPPYQEFGVKVDGEYRQLNDFLLQIENEYYSDIRPKRVTPSGKKPLQILKAQGVQYIEVRNLDINPFLPVGIDAQQVRFMDSFLLYCLLTDSPEISPKQYTIHGDNKQQVINRGREPGLALQYCDGESISLSAYAGNLLDRIHEVAGLLDSAHDSVDYRSAVKDQREKLANPDATPAARILETLNRENASFYEFGIERSLEHRESFLNDDDKLLSKARRGELEEEARKSIQKQEDIESRDELDFDAFLAAYLNQ